MHKLSICDYRGQVNNWGGGGTYSYIRVLHNRFLLKLIEVHGRKRLHVYQAYRTAVIMELIVTRNKVLRDNN